MPETITLQQVKCPSCGNILTSFNPFQSKVECPFCHTESVNPMITAKDVPVPERILLFNTNEKDFEKKLIETLIKRDYVPTDIFRKIRSEDVIRAYLPMYLFEGTYQASWSCEVGYEERETHYNSKGEREDRTVTRYRPANGQMQGNFNFLCLAYDGNEIPEELKRFSYSYPYNAIYSKEYDPALLGIGTDQSPMTLAPNTDKDTAWKARGNQKVQEMAQEAVKNQLSGQKIRGLHVTNSYDLKDDGRYVLAPFWFVYYTYDSEQRYYFVMDGMGEKADCTTPIDTAERDTVKKMWSRFKMMFWLLIPGFALYFIAKWNGVGIAFVIWLIATIIFGLVTRKQVKKRLAQSKEAREESARLMGLVDRATKSVTRSI